MRPLILFVDDDPAVLEAYQRALSRHFEVYLARGAWQGMVKVESGLDFSVVIADLHMPEMDGIEFLAKTREVLPQAVRIMMSVDARPECLRAASETVAVSAFIPKPCSTEQLLLTLFEWVQVWISRRFEAPESVQVRHDARPASSQQLTPVADAFAVPSLRS